MLDARSQYALGALAVTVFVAPLLVGGVFPWAIAVTTALAAVAALIASRCSPVRGKSANATWVDCVPLALVGWTAVQWIPLPARVTQALSPEAWDAWTRNAHAMGVSSPSWMPLSVDPGATQLELAKGAAIAAIYLTARLLRHRGLGHHVVKVSAGSIILTTTIGLMHEAVLADKLFGFYAPVHAGPRVLAPLLNENHLGGLAALGACLCLGLAVDARSAATRNGWALGAATCGLTCLLTMSRSGVIGLALSVILFAALMARQPAMRKRVRGQKVRGVVVAACGFIVLATVLAGPGLVREFSFTHNLKPKPEAAAAALPIIQDHPIMGVGRGAFSALFVRHHGTAKRFYHPENVAVQWTTEWGVPVAAALFAILAICAWLGVRRAKRASYVAAMAGLACLVVHDLADFALEMTGVVTVAAATFGAAVSLPDGTRLNVKLTSLALAAGIIALGTVGLAGSMHGWDVMTLERRVVADFADEQPEDVHRIAVLGLQKHPAEPLLAVAAAEAALRTNRPSTGAWINRAQDLAPRWSTPHLTAARWLLRLGNQDQAMLEVREAETKQRGAARTLVCELLQNGLGIDVLLRGAPTGAKGAEFLDRAAMCSRLTQAAHEQIDLAALDIHALSGPATRQARRWLARGEAPRAVELLNTVSDPNQLALAALAEAYGAVGDPRRGLAVLRDALGPDQAHAGILRAAASLYADQDEFQSVERLGAKLRGGARGDASRLAEAELFLGSLYEKRGRYGDALRHYQSAMNFSKNARTVRAASRAKEALYRIDADLPKAELDGNNDMRKAVPQP